MSEPLPPRLAERLGALREQPIEPTEKGFGLIGDGAARPTAASLAAGRSRLHAAGFGYPLLTLRETALEGNLAAMAAYCAKAGVELAPHGKTSMSPELAARQLANGAWGITVATIGQLRSYRAFGFPRLLLANELVDEGGIAWLAGELAADPGFAAYCYVDSLDGVAILDRVLTRHPAGRRLPVLVEIGHSGGRTGCRTDEQALAVAKAAAATGTLTVAGAAGYEGTIAGSRAELPDLVASFCRRLANLAGVLAGLADGDLIVTAGGSAYFDVVTRELTAGAATVILRSGGYLFHDHGMYQAVTPTARGAADAPVLRPALELWAQVLSRPEPGLALLGAGRRDVGFDAGLPVPLRALRREGASETSGAERVAGAVDVGGAVDVDGTVDVDGAGSIDEIGGAGVTGPLDGMVTQLNDQHAFLELDPGTPLAAGDLVCMGISHPCTTLDKWRVIPVLDDEDRVIDVVHTFF